MWPAAKKSREKEVRASPNPIFWSSTRSTLLPMSAPPWKSWRVMPERCGVTRPFVMCNLKAGHWSRRRLLSVYRARRNCSTSCWSHDQFLTVCGGQTFHSGRCQFPGSSVSKRWRRAIFCFAEPRDHTSGTSKDANTLTTSGPGVPPSLAMLRMSSWKQSAKPQRAG